MDDRLTSAMSPRELIKATMEFEKTDRVPWVDDFYDETIMKWFHQGLSVRGVTAIDWKMYADGGILLNWPTVKGFDANTYFGSVNFWGCVVPVDVGPIPRFKQRVVAQDDKYVESIMETGARAKRLRQREYIWYAMPRFTEFPVKDKKTWEQYKQRLDPHDLRRYPKDWEKDVYLDIFDKYQAGNTMITTGGFYGFGAELMGITNFNLAFYKAADLIEDMIEYWKYFTIETMRTAVETLKDRIDVLFWWEDLATKHGPNVSPKLYKEFFLPHYKEVTAFFHKNGIRHVLMDSDGNLNPILDLISDAGINGLYPLEVNASMDAREIRKEYGDKFFLRGNLDKREIAKGGESMRREVDSKVLPLKETRGYLACCDHDISPEFELDNFKEYAKYLETKLRN